MHRKGERRQHILASQRYTRQGYLADLLLLQSNQFRFLVPLFPTEGSAIPFTMLPSIDVDGLLSNDPW